jgi:hypothetical protein
MPKCRSHLFSCNRESRLSTHLEVACFLQVLDPLVGLPLGVDHQGPAPGGGHDDSVLDGEGVIRQPRNEPLSDLDRLSQDRRGGKFGAVGNLLLPTYATAKPFTAPLGGVTCGYKPCATNAHPELGKQGTQLVCGNAAIPCEEQAPVVTGIKSGKFVLHTLLHAHNGHV